MTTQAIERDLREIEQFIYREARLADASDYDAWEALWADDALYWVPVDGLGDPDHHVSVIYDNRSRIATRLAQLRTGKRYAQVPMSTVARVVSNIEVIETDGPDTVVGATFVLAESRVGALEWWAGHLEYRLRRQGEGLRMAGKKIVLVNNDQPLSSLSFLI
jgi:benzoate/toluate 1,2-dioxygenase beta subunit